MIYLLFIAMGLVLISLVAGLIVMAIGGEVNQKYSNKLMQFRVMSQGLAIILLGIMFMVK